LNAQVDVAAANALTATCWYVTTPAVAALLMARSRFSSGVATPLWEGSPLDGQVLGMRAMSSSQMPAGKAIFGDWSQVIVGEWGVLELSTSPSAESGDFAKGISTLRAMYSMDVAVRHAGAFSITSSIT
jgi:hypothetical protein